MKKFYEIDANFAEAWKSNKEPWSGEQIPFLGCFIQEGFLFRNQQLCIPRGSMRENLVREMHNGVLGGHLGMDKIYALVE